MNDLGDAIAWPMRDREWLTKIVVMSLITIIPIIGGIVLLGWMLAALDNLRAGRQELPPIGFEYIGRGFPLFVVTLAYTLAVAVAAGVIFALGVGAGAALGSASSAAAGAGASLGILLASAVAVAGFLGVVFLTPAMVVETERGGIGAGLNVARVIEVARRRPEASLAGALSLIVAYVLGSVGGFVCGLGVYLTIAYGYAVAAAVIRRYEIEIGSFGPAQVPAPPAIQ